MGFFSLKQIGLQFLALVIVILISFFMFVRPAITTIATHHTLTTVSDKASVDFQIPSPSNSQLVSLEQEPFIQKVFPYYDLFSDITAQDNTRIENTYIMLIESIRSKDFPFIAAPLQIKKITDVIDVALFIDSVVAKRYGIAEGDNISVDLGTMNITVPVAAIVYPPFDYLHIQKNQTGLLVLALSNATFTQLTAANHKTITYSGAYVRVSEYTAAKAFFKNYKPLGRMKNRKLFKSDVEYDMYVKSFYETSYEAEIRDFSSLSVGTKTITGKLLLACAVILFATIFSSVFLLFSSGIRGKAINRLRNGQKLSSLRGMIVIPLYITSGLSCILLLILESIVINMQTAFAPLYVYIPLFFITIVSYIIMSWGVLYVVTGKIVKKLS